MVLQRDCSNKIESRIWYGTCLGVNISFKHGRLRPCKDLNTFVRTYRYVFVLHGISPHWNETGSWIPSSGKRRTFLAYIDGLVQERGNSSALAMELRLSCTNPSTWPILLMIRGGALFLIQLFTNQSKCLIQVQNLTLVRKNSLPLVTQGARASASGYWPSALGNLLPWGPAGLNN